MKTKTFVFKIIITLALLFFLIYKLNLKNIINILTNTDIILLLFTIPLILLILIPFNAYGEEFQDYKQWAFVNHSILCEKYNGGESYGAWIIPEDFKPIIIKECFGYTTLEALEKKWKDKRAPVGIYAYYLENREKLWNRAEGRFITVE